MDFDIDAQPADQALTEFAHRTGVSVLFPFDEVSRREANPLVGRYTVEEALDVLLEDTGLEAVVDEGGVLIVRIVSDRDSETGTAAGRGSARGQEALPIFGAVAAGSAFGSRSARQMEEVTVTGSRIVRRDYEANSPILTVEAQAFESAGTVGIETVMNQLPQFVPAVTQFMTTDYQAEATNTPGSATLSLRGLGSNRNLVLLDGRRAMPVNASMTVDINTIPAAAIERVETITGGASSVYGADAVAGVVNFILKRDFEGAEFDAQYGRTQQGDGAEYRISGIFGISNPDETGNVWFGFEHASRDKVLEADRRFFRRGWADPSTPGTEDFYTDQGLEPDENNPISQAAVDAIFEDAAPGAVSPDNTFHLNRDGTVYTTEAGGAYRYRGPMTVDGAAWRFVADDGSLEENMLYRLASLPMERYSLFSRGRLDLRPGLTLRAQTLFSQTETHTQDDYSPLLGGWRARIPGAGDALYEPSIDEGGNTRPDYLRGGRFGLDCPSVGGCTYAEAFPVPDELGRLLASRPDPTAPWDVRQSATWAETPRSTDNKISTYQLVLGLEGILPTPGWTWELYASHGSTALATTMSGFVSLERWRFLAEQPHYGRGFFYTGNEIGNGFGAGVGRCESGLPIVQDLEMTQDCRDALMAPLQNTSDMVQDIVEFNLQGVLSELRSGPLQFALGASSRQNTYEFHTDILSSQHSYLDQVAGLFPASNASGKTSVRELYGELLVPLARDRRFARGLNLELGYRTSNNEPSEDVDTYKALLDWSVGSRLRIRGGWQVANRAPNIGELFLSRTQTWATSHLGDYCSEANPSNVNSANPALNPNAARVRAICEARMGAEGAARYYDAANEQPADAFSWRLANTVGSAALGSETAETATFGAVLELGDHATLTLDWWDIRIRDMISPQSTDAVYTQCMSPATNPTFDPEHPACRRILRNPTTGALAAVDVAYTNEGAVNTSGVDVQFNWGRPLRRGALNLNFLATVLTDLETRIAPGDEFTDWKGTSGPNDLSGLHGGAYDYKTFTTLTYVHDRWNLTARWRHLPGIASAASIQDPNDTSVPTSAYDLFDVSGGYRLLDDFLLRYGVDNLFDRQPERAFPDIATSAAGQTLPSFYDILGRRYYAGFTLRF